MTDRKQFEMSEHQLQQLLEAMKPVPMIMLQCGMPKSPQAQANDAWRRLGFEMGFDGMTVKPVGSNPRIFTAMPREAK